MKAFTATTTAFLLAGALVLSGCETSFEVFGESDAYFSIFGFLDVSADTQWVRIEALQDSMLTNTRPLHADVMMTNLSSGERVAWKDSLFHFVQGATAYNAWTTTPIHPLETYRLDVLRSDGASSSVTVTMPDTFPDPLINVYPFSLINLPVSGNVCAKSFEMILRMERFAALEVTYRVPTLRGVIRQFKVSYVNQVEYNENGFYEVEIPWAKDLLELEVLEPDIRIQELLRTEGIDLLVAAAGPEWPDNTLTDETVALPDAVTHVQNGFGFLGGVASKRLHIPLGDYRDVSCFQ